MTDSGQAIDHIVIAVRDLDRIAARYEALGFTLTPRAQHAWGTANRLVQFRGRNFIELLEIDRPELIPDPDPPQFGFGAFNRDFLARREGFSMLVLQGTDSRADVARFEAAGLDSYAPFDFERQATLPDGAVVRVAFSIALRTAINRSRNRAAFSNSSSDAASVIVPSRRCTIRTSAGSSLPCSGTSRR